MDDRERRGSWNRNSTGIWIYLCVRVRVCIYMYTDMYTHYELFFNSLKTRDSLFLVCYSIFAQLYIHFIPLYKKSTDYQNDDWINYCSVHWTEVKVIKKNSNNKCTYVAYIMYLRYCFNTPSSAHLGPVCRCRIDLHFLVSFALRLYLRMHSEAPLESGHLSFDCHFCFLSAGLSCHSLRNTV